MAYETHYRYFASGELKWHFSFLVWKYIIINITKSFSFDFILCTNYMLGWMCFLFWHILLAWSKIRSLSHLCQNPISAGTANSHAVIADWSMTQRAWINTPRPHRNGCHFVDGIFEFIFLNDICCVLIQISSTFVPLVLIAKTCIIGLDNGLSPVRRQAIIWSNDDLFCWRIYTSLDLDELTH